MEYILGATTAIAAFFVFSKFIKPLRNYKPVPIRFTQTHVFELVRPSLEFLAFTNKPDSQTKRLSESNLVDVLIYEDKAYWIRHNSVFVADVVEGSVDQQTAIAIDTMNMSKPELDKLSFVIEKLTEGKSDDRRNPGY